ncbi:MAG TPA: hypothetical protein VN693_00375 [Rhodanobacteraceae bacterium]|nr:hypothetical protein [Rhodanobacteraceae bacterium]
MKPSSTRIATPILLLALAACSQAGGNANGATTAPGTTHANAASSGNDWAGNGATACEKYLTPDFVAQIFSKPEGHAKKLAGWSCSYETSDFSNINITLMNAGPAAFEADQKNLSDPKPLSGVGDKAVNSMTGVEAVKGNRMCDIGVMPPFGNKLGGDALAHKLGEVCNKLFALP